MTETSMTRRTFAKLAGIAAAATTLGVPAVNNLTESKKAYAEGEVVKQATNCSACISHCSIIASIQNGRVIRLEGNKDDLLSRGRVCPKGLSGISALYHPNRTKYPMRRVGEHMGAHHLG